MRSILSLTLTSLLAFVATGCATSKAMMGPNGKQAYFVRCPGGAIDTCYEEAAKVCPRGYVFADKGNNAPGVLVPVGNLLVAGRGPNTMLVECKE